MLLETAIKTQEPDQSEYPSRLTDVAVKRRPRPDTSTYAYDKDNRLTKATEGAISANYTYDSFSRMTGLTAKNGVPLTTKMPHI